MTTSEKLYLLLWYLNRELRLRVAVWWSEYRWAVVLVVHSFSFCRLSAFSLFINLLPQSGGCDTMKEALKIILSVFVFIILLPLWVVVWLLFSYDLHWHLTREGGLYRR